MNSSLFLFSYSLVQIGKGERPTPADMANNCSDFVVGLVSSNEEVHSDAKTHALLKKTHVQQRLVELHQHGHERVAICRVVVPDAPAQDLAHLGTQASSE